MVTWESPFVTNRKRKKGHGGTHTNGLMAKKEAMREGEAVEKGDQELFLFCRRWYGSQARGGLILKA